MDAPARSFRPLASLALCCAAGAAAAAGPGAEWRNVTAGGALRPGVYGRIEVRADAGPPPLIYREPVVADGTIERVVRQPVYLYVPPGQVRKWKQNCARWSACAQAVLFVRMDQSPSRWGQWRQLREQVAWQDREAP